jgi:hypothetical protein
VRLPVRADSASTGRFGRWGAEGKQIGQSSRFGHKIGHGRLERGRSCLFVFA